jgi:Cu-processing system permease protein
MNQVLIVAQKEFRDGIRNRWAISISIVFVLLSLGIAYFGSAAAGELGFSSLESTLVSLGSLCVMLIPLIALMLAYNSFVGELEQGTLLLLLTYPLSHNQMLLGKFLGQAAILSFAALIGFGIPAVVIASVSEVAVWDVFSAFGCFILVASLLGWVFIAMAYVISLGVSEKSKAAGLALVVWFIFVLVFDLLLMALLVASEGDINQTWVPYLLWLNPTDVFRIFVYMIVGSTQFAGVLSIAEQGMSTVGYLTCVMIIWVVIPLLLSSWMLKRKELS